jgi:hypothetical protein
MAAAARKRHENGINNNGAGIIWHQKNNGINENEMTKSNGEEMRNGMAKPVMKNEK